MYLWAFHAFIEWHRLLLYEYAPLVMIKLSHFKVQGRELPNTVYISRSLANEIGVFIQEI